MTRESIEMRVFQCSLRIQRIWRMFPIIAILSLMVMRFVIGIEGRLEVNDSCTTQSMPGICKAWSDCPIMAELIQNGRYTRHSVRHCGFNINEELICCPLRTAHLHQEEATTKVPSSNKGDNDPQPKPMPSKKHISLTNDKEPRIAVRACEKYERGLVPALTPHILGGTPAELGEFPHMAAIGYSNEMQEDRPPYKIRCGGSLISERFVLTAAHCVTSQGFQPRIVRLGIVNLTDPQEIRSEVNVRIKKIYRPSDYRSWETYNDIALLELQREVELTQNVYPICLYTDDTDPSTAELNVIGWGVVNVTTRVDSEILLQVPLNIVPLDSCNESYKKLGRIRQLGKGVIDTQLCAIDRQLGRDACAGDSGGPLNLVIDKVNRRYRLLGIVAAGFYCGSAIPGLYTRVASFLDYIESLVWPNGVI